MAATLPVSVVVATIGRPKLLEACVTSVLACRPGPDDVVIVDQSDAGLADRMRALGDDRIRVVPSPVRGISRAVNDGLRAARHDTVMMTDDDCTVAPDWIAAGWDAHALACGGLVSGRVLPAGDPALVPSAIVSTEFRDWTGVRTKGSLYRGNMVGSAAALLAIGGFDERATLRSAAEDNDFCYRWAKAGLPLHYDPLMVVWHHDWRSASDLRTTYRTYAKGQGAFYAKHLAQGDLHMVRFVASDVREGVRARRHRLLHQHRHDPPTRRELLVPWLFVGLVAGWREERRFHRQAAEKVR